MMQIKLNRGPGKGHTMVVEDHTRSVRINYRPPFKPSWLELEPMNYPHPEEHEYVRSHRRLKNGTVIFEWMGEIL